MKVISELNYKQPSGIEVKLREMEISYGLFGHPYSAERLIGYGSSLSVQEGWYGWPSKTTRSIMMGWRHFEERLQLEVELG